MAIHPLAGSPAPASVLVDVSKLIAAYFSEKPDAMVREQRVTVGTSGHRGSAFKRSFNEWHILAITQAICEYRAGQGTSGPLYLGRDTHALSEPAVRARSTAPGNGASIGGLKVVTGQGWFAARPSGTEDAYKLYAESFQGKDHLRRIQEEAQALIGIVLARANS